MGIPCKRSSPAKGPMKTSTPPWRRAVIAGSPVVGEREGQREREGETRERKQGTGPPGCEGEHWRTVVAQSVLFGFSPELTRTGLLLGRSFSRISSAVSFSYSFISFFTFLFMLFSDSYLSSTGHCANSNGTLVSNKWNNDVIY